MSLFSQDGNRLPEGNYTWELQVIPRLTAATRERLNRSREVGEDSGLNRLRISGKLPEQPLVQSGYFSIRGGSFVTAAPTDVVAAVKPNPPLRSAADKQVIAEDLVVQGGACVGASCANGDTNSYGLRIKSAEPSIFFTDVPDQITADRDWALRVGVLGEGDRLYISDDDSGNKPFSIEGGAPSSAVYIRSNGNLGLRTAAAAAPLHVNASATSDTYVGLGPAPDSGPAFNIGYGGSSFGRGAAFLNTRPDAAAAAPNPSLRFLIGNTERMIIDNEGYIGLGVANPTHPIQHSSGAYLSTGGTWTNASSRSVKHDIQELDAADARAALAGLAPVRFRYNAEPDDELLGFIAEDVPDLVATSDHKSLSPMDIVAVLTKMVQEQERTIQELKARVEELESRQP